CAVDPDPALDDDPGEAAGHRSPRRRSRHHPGARLELADLVHAGSRRAREGQARPHGRRPEEEGRTAARRRAAEGADRREVGLAPEHRDWGQVRDHLRRDREGRAPPHPLLPAEPGYVTQRFPNDQGQLQVRYVGRRVALQSMTGDAVAASALGTSQTYNIRGGKIVTALVGTPIEVAVYKLGDKYLGARSNEFGYANYEIIPVVSELNPLR